RGPWPSTRPGRHTTRSRRPEAPEAGGCGRRGGFDRSAASPPKPAFSFWAVIDRAIIPPRPQKKRGPEVPRWCGGHHPVGDAECGPVRLSFNPQLRVEFRGATVTSDAGLPLPRELDERLGLSALIERNLSDPRSGRNSQFSLADLFRQS